ncbi:MAG: Protein cbp3, mitochondrial [Peltula sp. TS41687]|nr:MAG: Protein cbp3, mitochondrial [Peltula sp. TS41687]
MPTSDPPTIHNSSSSKPPSTVAPSQNLDFVPPPNAPASLRVAQEVRKRAPVGVTETYIAYGATQKLYKECAAQADYTIPEAADQKGEIPKTAGGIDRGVDLHLPATFSTWSQITMLHIYLFAVRIRHFPAAHAPAWQQHLLDHFFFDAEQRMTTLHRITAQSARNRYLKDLFVQYRGAMAAYDEGLFKGDAVLATALWRNVFAADDDVDLRRLACVVGYVRRTVRALEMIDDQDVAGGLVRFAEPGRDAALVRVRSRWLDRPFVQEKGVGG